MWIIYALYGSYDVADSCKQHPIGDNRIAAFDILLFKPTRGVGLFFNPISTGILTNSAHFRGCYCYC